MPKDPQRDIAKLLGNAWFPGVGLIVLFVGMALWGPPEDWFYTLAGFAFLPVLVLLSLFSLRYGATAFMWSFMGAWLLQGWLSSTVIAVERMGGGGEFIMQLCISAAGTYLFLFAFRKHIMRWLFPNGAI